MAAVHKNETASEEVASEPFHCVLSQTYQIRREKTSEKCWRRHRPVAPCRRCLADGRHGDM